MKKTVAILLVFTLAFAFAACGKKGDAPAVTQATRGDLNMQEVVITEALTDAQGEVVTQQGGEAVIVTEIHTEPITEPESLAADPEQWSKEEIIAFYKSSAIKSHPDATSTQTMELDHMIVNNGDGALGFFVKMADPIIKKALAKNSTSYGGITGGFNNLAVEDAASLKAYKSGEYTVIEMQMKEQTDGTYGSPYDGSVGHAISVLGNVDDAISQLDGVTVDYSKGKISLTYKNPYVKVLIDENGNIVKGTWHHEVNVLLTNVAVGVSFINATLNGTKAVINYHVTMGGGF